MDLVTFPEEILNRKLHFLCSVIFNEWKSLDFFSLYLFEIDQAQLKNSNYDVIFSVWLISMEIYHRWIFISIWNFPVQINNFSVQKENVRTKLENSEMHLELCQTSKMKLFPEILNDFQLLLFLLSKLLSTLVQSEPSQICKMELYAEILNGVLLLTVVFIAETISYRCVFRA